MLRAVAATAAVLAGLSGVARAEGVLNLYSARHYQTDEALYTNFTVQTGIKINRIDGNDDEIVERLRQEGANSPADVLLLVDAGRLWRAAQAGLFQPVKSAVLEERIPASLRDKDDLWFGFSRRARVILYARDKIKAGEITTYADLANPKWKGKVCMRSSSAMYNLSLLAATIDHVGAEKAEAWARGVVANFARPPKGGDTDQIKAVAAGECQITIANTYYFVRFLKSDKPDDKHVADKVAVVFPDQNGAGTHVNISGGGVAKNAPDKAAAVKFLEYLASDGAQSYFANGNNEYPVTETAGLDNPALRTLGSFKADALNVTAYGRNQAEAQKIYDRVGWK